MPLSWNEIRDRSVAFSKEWKDETSETAEAQSFWNAFFTVFGVNRRRVARFEAPVKKSDGKGGFIDLLWKGVLLVEHKSRGKDLDRANKQATDYFAGLKDRDLPRYVLVSDFARFRLYDLDAGEDHEFELRDLHKNLKRFGFIAGYETRSFGEQDPVNVKAAEKLGKLHDQLKKSGYDNHHLEVLLVRILFCLFAEDNGIFETQQFREWVELRVAEDGSDFGPLLAQLFQTLNTPPEKRHKTLDEQLAAFQYINGKLFEEVLPLASFDRKMRETVLECAAINWSRISPAIFGALFQSIKDKKLRRNLGEHYTSETNILKALNPLFLDGLRAEFGRVKRDRKRLQAFHAKLGKIHVLDPACGCGNFLVVAYRELRLIELDVLRELYQVKQASKVLDVDQIVFVDVDQFYGIELEDFPAQIAQVALWMTDHQMNIKVSEEFGEYFARLPLKKSPTIIHDNALQIDWKTVVAPEKLQYIVGNPPFIGHHLQSKEQKAEMLATYGKNKAAGVMDYVTGWYNKAAAYIQGNDIQVAFVSTNSITQGEQVGILWRSLLSKYKVAINFAHRTFQWTSEARGKAAVYCVIIGFAANDADAKVVFEYDSPDGEPHATSVKTINAYLVDAPWILLENRSRNPFGMPEMMYGSKPTDNGNFLFTDEEKVAFLKAEPKARKYVKPFVSAHEYLHAEKRWVLWLVGADPADIADLPAVRERVKAVDKFRKASKAATTRAYRFPTLFRQVTQPIDDYVLIPGHTSENRAFIPFGFFDKNHIVGNSCFSLPGANLFHFGVLQSTQHMAWVRYTCGRLESRYRYSKDIVYNNYPWPDASPKQREAIEAGAQAVIDAREEFPATSLADLYDPLAMPPSLSKAHQALDRAVDQAYGRTAYKSEAERLAFLFELLDKQAAMFPAPAKKTARKRAAKVAI